MISSRRSTQSGSQTDQRCGNAGRPECSRLLSFRFPHLASATSEPHSRGSAQLGAPSSRDESRTLRQDEAAHCRSQTSIRHASPVPVAWEPLPSQSDRNLKASRLLESRVSPHLMDAAFHPQFCHHRAHRPRQIHAGRPPAGADRIAHRARDAGPGARLHGPGARARHHHQGPRRAHDVHRAGRPDLSAQPDRHARPRGFFLRSLALAGLLRRRACWWSMLRRASRRRRWPMPISPSITASKSFPSSTRSTCPAPTSSAPRR